jgi:hypothetical protein
MTAANEQRASRLEVRSAPAGPGQDQSVDLLKSAGDFREFSPKKFENGATGDFQQSEKPAIGGPFCY